MSAASLCGVVNDAGGVFILDLVFDVLDELDLLEVLSPLLRLLQELVVLLSLDHHLSEVWTNVFFVRPPVHELLHERHAGLR